jgi:nucleoside-diphosphate-sugar epimerase
MKHPLEYNRVNINGLVNMLQAAAHAKIKRFVFASSSAVYGDAKEFPQQEEHLPRPISPYALNKLAGEHYCQIFAHSFGLETVALRYFNIFGPKQALDDEYAVVIPKFIHCLVNNQPTPIFGNGEQSRDFTYIDNVVLANILAATTPGLKHEVFNVASGIENTVLNLALTLNKVLNKNIQPQFLPLRTGDLFRSTADISKITKAAGYKPTVGFEEGLKKTVEYFKTKWA